MVVTRLLAPMLVSQTGFLLPQSKFHSHQEIFSYMLGAHLEQGISCPLYTVVHEGRAMPTVFTGYDF